MRKPEKLNPSFLGVFAVFFLASSCALIAQAGLPPLPSYYKAKGNIIVGTGAGQASPLPSSTDNYVLSSDSAAAGGVSWQPNPAVSATPSNTPNTLVKRDSSGNFAGETITATTFNATSTTASLNIGGSAFLSQPQATSNVVLGNAAGALFASGATRNTCMGQSACAALTTGDEVTAIGYQAFITGTANNNTAIGSGALNGGSGASNTAVGYHAGNVITTATHNVAVGVDSLLAAGNDNVAVGSQALTSSSSSSVRNTGLGRRSLLNATSNDNVAVGYQACQTLTTGGTNTCLGTSSDISTNNLTNATAIGYNAAAAVSNAIVLGTSTNLVGIGTSSPTHKLDVVGSSDIVQSVTKAHSSQTANVMEWQTSAGVIQNSIDKNGRLTQDEHGPQVNLLGLSTGFVLTGPTGTTDRDAEISVGNWAAYADAAATQPDDANGMTGGSPNTTCTRSTSSPLNGIGHFLMTLTTGATRQGEGCATVVNIPPAYRGAMLEFSFPFTTTGTITEDDIKLYAYDVTNSTVITPYAAGKVLGAGPGKASAIFPISTTTAQIRVGLHIARASNTGAVAVLFDDVSVSPQVSTYGMAGSDSTSYTLTIGGTTSAPTQGSGATKTATYTRIGQGLLIHFDYTQANAGSAGTGTYLFPLPSGLTATEPTASTGGTLASVGQAAVATAGTKRDAAVVLYNSTNIAIQMESAGTDPTFVGSTVAGLDVASTVYSFTAWIPAISGWSSNVTMANSSTFKISSYLASGSRVTATPTLLGQYRSQLRDAGALTFTDTNGTPTATPTVADGMRIYNGNAYTSADTNSEPTRYEIFVGKNKQVFWQFYASAARTGYANVSPIVSSGADYGYHTTYDPSTGVAVITGNRFGNSSTTHSSGISSNGGATLNDPYFDLIVSENALAVGVQAPRSYVVAYNGNGHGSTGTKIRKYTNSTSVGTAITYTSDATNGDKFTINEDGLYSMAMTDGAAASSRRFGISLNAASNTASMDTTLGVAEVLGMTTNVAAVESSVTVTWFLPAGSIIRAKDDSGCDFTGAANSMFRITKVSN